MEGGLRIKKLLLKNSSPGNPLVSVITVVLNGEKYLEQAIQSIINQTYNNVEYIIIDGGSTDGTLEIITKYECHIDYWTSEPDHGLYDAMNKGIDLCTGEIIGILNSDDWYEYNAIAKVVDAFLRYPAATLIHGAMRKWSINGNLDAIYSSKKNLSPFLFMPFNHPTCFIKKNVYNRLGKFDTYLATAADYDFALRFQKGGGGSVYIDDVLSNFRKTGITSQRGHVPIHQSWHLLRKNGYSYLKSFEGVAFRTLRDIVGIIISIPLLKSLKKIVISILPYRKYS